MLPSTSFSRTIVIASGAFVLSGILQLGTAWLQHLARTSPDVSVSTSPQTYTWKRGDFPNALEIDLGEKVAMTFEDSPHYSLDTPNADAEWQSIYPGDSYGFVRLGPEKRFFGVSVYHSLHCLNSLRAIILGRMDEPLVIPGLIGSHLHTNTSHRKRDAVAHAPHCLNYLRQAILCNADLTLEPEYYEGALNVPGSGATHVCRDWSKVFAYVEDNAKEFNQWQQEQGVGSA